jgi:hypothetical protein
VAKLFGRYIYYQGLVKSMEVSQMWRKHRQDEACANFWVHMLSYPTFPLVSLDLIKELVVYFKRLKCNNFNFLWDRLHDKRFKHLRYQRKTSVINMVAASFMFHHVPFIDKIKG